MRYVNSQEEFNDYIGPYLNNIDHQHWIEFYPNFRKLLFMGRLWMYAGLFRYHYKFDSDFRFLTPGLEAKFACEQAEKHGS